MSRANQKRARWPTGSLTASFAGSVTRIVFHLNDGQVVVVDAFGTFNRPTPIGVAKT